MAHKLRVLVAVDGSLPSGRALEHVIDLSRAGALVDIHLLNVQIPVESGHVRMFVTPEEIDGWYRDEGIAELEPSRIALDAAGVLYTQHIAVGHLVETICRYAAEQDFDLLVMGSRGRSGLGSALMGSVARGVLAKISVPLTLVK